MIDNKIGSDINKFYTKACIEEAGKSKCDKVKVGAIIANIHTGEIIGSGHNNNPDGSCCEHEHNKNITKDEVIHAEVAAVDDALDNIANSEYISIRFADLEGCVMYVTLAPCEPCKDYALSKGILAKDIIVIESFVKHNKGKIRYDLLPTDALRVMAEVMTVGAQRYGKDNWKSCDDIDVWLAALMRHLEAYRAGELIDCDSKNLHMAHVLVNAAFITYLITKKDKENGQENNNKT